MRKILLAALSPLEKFNVYVLRNTKKHFFVACANVSDIQEQERASEREVCSGSGTDH